MESASQSEVHPNHHPPDVRFFTVAGPGYHAGLVAMVNSLRLHGHTEPVTVLDLGLSDAERAELGAECDLVAPPAGTSDNPWLLVPQACQARRAEVVVYVDCDTIVTGSLAPIIDAARRGGICVFPDTDQGGRRFEEWEEIFDLAGPPRRQRYANSGFLAFSADHFPSLLRRWQECCDRIVQDAGRASWHDDASPVGFADQDALNALLMSEVDAEAIVMEHGGVASQGPAELARTRVVDRRRLVCRRDGHPTLLLHAWGLPKPWQPAAGPTLQRNAYVRCLGRLLDAPDLAVRTSRPRVPWLAPGARGAAALRWRTTSALVRRGGGALQRVGMGLARQSGVLPVLRAGAQPVRSLRWALDPSLARAYPHLARRVRVASVVAAVVWGAALGTALVVDSWIFLAIVTLAFAGEAVVLAWSARPQRGRTHGWPPGSLRPGHAAKVDHDHYAEGARRHGPVFKTRFGAPMVSIVDLGLARDLFRVRADDLGHAWDTVERFVPGGSIRECQGSRHAELRRLRTKTLTAAAVRSWEPTLAHHVRAHLEAMVRDADTSGRPIAPLHRVREMVTAAWSDTMLGIPPGDPTFAEVSSLLTDLDPDRHLYGRALPDDEIESKLDRLVALVADANAPSRRSGTVPSLAGRLDDVRPGAITDPAIGRDFLYETINTRDDVAGLLVWILKFLADDPGWLARLRAANGDGLAERIVSETLRLAQSEYLFRRARSGIEHDGTVIPAGWIVRVCIREIHRDPAHFEHADRFDPDRFLDGGYGRDVYAPFGIDHHACVGETLARTMGRVLVDELARGFDVRTVRDGPVELSVERHWAPSPRWRIAITARATAPADGTGPGRPER